MIRSTTAQIVDDYMNGQKEIAAKKIKNLQKIQLLYLYDIAGGNLRSFIMSVLKKEIFSEL